MMHQLDKIKCTLLQLPNKINKKFDAYKFVKQTIVLYPWTKSSQCSGTAVERSIFNRHTSVLPVVMG